MKHSDFRDCIPNLAFVLTRGKGWSSKPRMSPGNLGNCAPTALSYACNVDYDEVCDRLVMVGKCLAECADLCAELSEISGFDPNLGTPVYVWVNFLRLYGFGPRDQFPCICKRAEPIVLAGFTGPRETHLATVINGEALGGYDITQKPNSARRLRPGISPGNTELVPAQATPRASARRQPEPDWVGVSASPAGVALQAPVSTVPRSHPSTSTRASLASLQVR